MLSQTIHPTIITFAGHAIKRGSDGSVRITHGNTLIDDFTAVEFDRIAQRVKAVVWMTRRSSTRVKHVLILAMAGAITPHQLRDVESDPDAAIGTCIAGAMCTILVTGLPVRQAPAA